jgi:hypothetical protein
VHTAGSWQAAGPAPGQDPRNTGSWQAAGPAAGRGGAAGPGQYGQDPRNTGSWRAAGPDQAYDRAAGPGPSGQNFRNTGSWQAAGPAAGQDWAGPGQHPFAGQSQPGQYPGQQQHGTGRPGDQHYGDGDGVGPGTRNTGAFGTAGGPVITQRDSALPDQPPGVKGPIAALELDSVAAFARDLRVLRATADLDYPDMAEKSHYTMRTLASAAGGLRLPTLPVLIAYVNACGGDVTEWEKRWGKLTESGKKSPVALPVALPVGSDSGGTASAAGKIPAGARQTGEIYVITSAKPRDDRW